MISNLDPKVAAGGVAGALAIVLIWLWNLILPSYPIPAEEAATLSTVISFVAGYLKRNGVRVAGAAE
jgi:hypothetical protein